MTGTVLAYHAIGRCDEDRHNLFVSESRFAEQMHFLASERHVLPLEDVFAGSDRRAVAITFDDGYKSVYRSALPILESHGFPATVFVPTAHIGGSNTWDAPLGCDLDIIDEGQMRDALSRGLDIQSHGHNHIDMSQATSVQIQSDLSDSRNELKRVTGVWPRYLAYPYCTGSVAAQRAARDLGFDGAFSIDLPDRGRFAVGRVQVAPGDSMRLFALKTSGYYLALRHSRALSLAYRALKPFLRNR